MRYWNGAYWTAEEATPSTVTNNSPRAVAETSEPNHLLHLILTICTCGLWLPVWLAVTLLDPRRDRVVRGFVSAHPVLTGIAVLAGPVLIMADWKAFVLLASLVAVVTGLVMLAMLAVRSRRRRRQEKADIAARADDQHEALLRGDDQWGVFGIKPPAEVLVEPPPTSRTPGRESLAITIGTIGAIALLSIGGFFGYKFLFAKSGEDSHSANSDGGFHTAGSDEDQIKALVQAWTNDLNNRDLAGLKSLMCSGSASQLPRDVFFDRDRIGTISSEVTDINVTGDRATATITSRWSERPNGGERHFDSYGKENGNWKICHTVNF
jgi:hypothetical protein